jgi:hypothetical protein
MRFLGSFMWACCAPPPPPSSSPSQRQRQGRASLPACVSRRRRHRGGRCQRHPAPSIRHDVRDVRACVRPAGVAWLRWAGVGVGCRSNYPGALRSRMAHPAEMCYRIPDHVSFDEAAMLEPMAVATQAVKRGRIKMGDRYYSVLPATPPRPRRLNQNRTHTPRGRHVLHH